MELQPIFLAAHKNLIEQLLERFFVLCILKNVVQPGKNPVAQQISEDFFHDTLAVSDCIRGTHRYSCRRVHAAMSDERIVFL